MISQDLREIADCIDKEYAGETISFSSQNMSTGKLADYTIISNPGSSSDISCRGERLSTDKVTIKGKWIVQGGRGRGIFQTPDGKMWLVRGNDGDPYYASSMFFTDITNNALCPHMILRAKEGHRISFHSHWKRWETENGLDLVTLRSNYEKANVSSVA